MRRFRPDHEVARGHENRSARLGVEGKSGALLQAYRPRPDEALPFHSVKTDPNACRASSSAGACRADAQSAGHRADPPEAARQAAACRLAGLLPACWKKCQACQEVRNRRAEAPVGRHMPPAVRFCSCLYGRVSEWRLFLPLMTSSLLSIFRIVKQCPCLQMRDRCKKQKLELEQSACSFYIASMFTLTSPSRFEQDIKKSRFLALAAPVADEADAKAFLASHAD